MLDHMTMGWEENNKVYLLVLDGLLPLKGALNPISLGQGEYSQFAPPGWSATTKGDARFGYHGSKSAQLN